MTPTLLPERHFIGKFIQSPINTAATQELWKSFMPLRKQINAISEELFSVIVPTEDTRKSGQLTMHSTVDKWAAVEVDPSYPTPENLDRLIIPAGDYLSFEYVGRASDYGPFIGNIHGNILPQNGFAFDMRPQFEVMGAEYLGHDNPNSRETLYVPVRRIQSDSV